MTLWKRKQAKHFFSTGTFSPILFCTWWLAQATSSDEAWQAPHDNDKETRCLLEEALLAATAGFGASHFGIGFGTPLLGTLGLGLGIGAGSTSLNSSAELSARALAAMLRPRLAISTCARQTLRCEPNRL